MRNYLVVANQTLPGAELSDAIRKRLEAGPSRFHVLVPNTPARDLAADFGSGWVGGLPRAPGTAAPGADQATAHARHRLGQLLGDLRRLGVEADGELGDADPLKAVGAVLQSRQVDEILLSTLPKPVSRWLGMDLPQRLQHRFRLPVTTIITKG